ncbi:MAG: hypothetical protein IJB11_08055, partial [Oscillospiraceae bacterium]|nr:hypothetical protein [Oscillospiraceae bacterium]
MCKRVLSMLLCLAMVMSFVPVASAQEIVADTNAGQNILEDGTIHYDGAGEVKVDKDGNITITESGKTPEPTLSPIKIAVAECDCGKGDADLLIHSDNCALKDYCVELAASDANAIYQAWFGLPANARDAIYADLTENYPDTLTELRVKLDAAVNGWEGEVNEEYEDDFEEGLNLLPGSASTVVDGVTVNAEGLPEDSSLTVKEPSKQVMNAVEDAMEDVQETPHELFVYDISVQNDESSDWQPDGTDVLMTLTVPGVKLHKYATVKVVHVDDEGNTSFIEAGVDEDGNIVFATEGFSTFYGFTVDFEYGTAMFSIPGKSSIKISEMLDQLRMPLNAEDVVDVKFTDYSLLTVERLEEEQDWLLTSLKAFTTHETLTLTMNDGTIYEIKVTDATVQIKVGANGEWKTDSNNTTTWFCDGDGDPSNSRDDDVANPAYYSPDTFIYVGGTGTFTFAIQPADHCTTDGSRTYLTMKGIRISGGADVVFRIGGWFKDTSGGNTWGAGYSYYGVTNFNNIKEVVVQASANENLFSVYDGSLTLECEYSGIEWVLNGYNNDSKTYNYAYTNSDCGPIRMYDGAKSFVANKVRFRNIQRGAIVLSPAAMTEFKMTNCVFEDTVSRTTYGGAIYLQQAALTVNQSTYASSKKTNSKGENYYSSIDKFSLENVDFYGNHAETGGAIVLRGRVYEINIDSACLFDGCQTKSLDTSKTPKDGGAIYCDAAVGEFKVSAEFKNCTASRNGGAICVE